MGRENMRRVSVVMTALAATAISACVNEKSANPLAPTVAGPIPGVTISAPVPMDPAPGTRVAVDHQPLTLTFGNAKTTGVRPLSYRVEVATDVGFSSPVFSRDGVAPGSGQTAFRLPDALGTERTYYWRARAEDGANTGPFSSAANFDVYTPVVIGQPVLIAPVHDTVTTNMHPTFRIGNAPRSGPAGPITYQVQIDYNAGLTAPGEGFFPEIAGETTFAFPADLPVAGQHYFWRARALEATTTGPWSTIQSFSTPAVLTGGGGGGGGNVISNPADGLSLGSAIVTGGAAPDVASWPVTTTISQLVLGPGAYCRVEFDAKSRWPESTPPGWAGGIQYTLWMVRNVGGQLYTSGGIEFWIGRGTDACGPVTDYIPNWFYSVGQWGPLASGPLAAGEQVGFFVTQGDERAKDVHTLRERSQVVVVTWQGGSGVSAP